MIEYYIPVIAALIGSIVFLWLSHWFLLGRHQSMGTKARLPRQLVMFGFTISALVLVIILLPLSDSTRGQVITLLGLIITGVIALSSTSFVANVMAGLMLHVIKSFNPGDFIRVGQIMGRVTERGLFHTEIQTEDRDLTTLPNLLLATNPITVVHSTGTIISAELSLGYDIPRTLIEELLKQAALRAEFQDPFVLILSLGDFSVVYRVSAFLADVKSLITAKSLLKKCVLDVLHENDIEIVSPNFMNQRQLSEYNKIIPEKDTSSVQKSPEEDVVPEELIFDKADDAADTENLKEEINSLDKKINELSKSKKTLAKNEKEEVDLEIKRIEEKKQYLNIELLNKISDET